MRVVIAEDSVLLREGLTRLLAEAGYDVVAAVADAEEFLRAVGEHEPGRRGGRRADAADASPTRACGPRWSIRGRWPDVGVLVLSQYVEERYATELHRRPTARRRLPAQGPGRRRGRVPRRAATGSAAGGSALDPEVVAQLLARSRRPARRR